MYRAGRRRRARSSGSGCCPRAVGVLAGVRRRPHLLRLRERHRLQRCAPATAPCAGSSRPPGAVKAGLALANGKLFFGDYSGPRLRDPPDRRRPGLGDRHQAARASGCGSGQFYSTPAVAYGRVYIGNTDGAHVLVLVGQRQARLDQGHRLLRLLLARRRAGPGRRSRRVFFGSYDGVLLRRSTPATARSRWTHRDGGKISGGATVVGDIVYFSNSARRTRPASACAPAARSSSMGRGVVQPRDLRRPDDLPDRLLVAVRAQAREEIGRIGKPAGREGLLDLGDRVGAVVEDRGGTGRRPRRPAGPSIRCCGCPTPPEAITGTSTALGDRPRERAARSRPGCRRGPCS